MAGSPNFDRYILYSHDGVSYHFVVDETDTPQKFNGPLDSRTPQQTSTYPSRRSLYASIRLSGTDTLLCA
ncbi:unnamed protein product [Ceratitis capitata]|uniref:(Mediterranean fruit fly) hypothetical protein n=1 Tax=Ceratitis capitata TaxID=7213 RepID=A0A811V4K5_CERCA|nr:unnamed protein product [Ceratitis capitata]